MTFSWTRAGDPDAIYVDNGDIDKWLRARADRIEREAGESDGDA